VWLGTLYNLAAGAYCLQVYGSWNERPMIWDWHRAYAKDPSVGQVRAGYGVWIVLLAVVAAALWYTWRSLPPAEAAPGSPGDDEEVHPEARMASA
jgi:hypothetical protein